MKPEKRKFWIFSSLGYRVLVLICLLSLIVQMAWSQSDNWNEYVFFENPATLKKIRIEPGYQVAIRLKFRNARLTGIILHVSDSTLILGVGHEQKFISFRGISELKVIPRVKKRYVVAVTLRTGRKLSGDLVGIFADSIGMMVAHDSRPTHINAAEIASIKIHRKGAITKSMLIFAGSGALLGRIIGTWVAPTRTYDGLFGPYEVMDYRFVDNAAVIGAATGLIVGTIVGSHREKFKIEGNHSEFVLFSMKFKDKIRKP